MTLSNILLPPLYCEDPTALNLWVRLLHILQDIRDGADIGTGQIITLGLGLGYRVLIHQVGNGGILMVFSVKRWQCMFMRIWRREDVEVGRLRKDI